MKESFEKYLQKQKLRDSTISWHIDDIVRFKKWMEIKNSNETKVNYNDVLNFIQETSKRGVSRGSLNNQLNSIRKYYNYLIATTEQKENPAAALRIKNNEKKILQNILTTAELEEIYIKYINKPDWKFRGEQTRKNHKKNIVVLGLMMYQGLQTTELKKLEKNHINLLQGNIYIPLAARSNSRILKLDAKQIIPLQQYLQDVELSQEKLFKGPLPVASILKKLKQQKTKTKTNQVGTIKNMQQIRSSVIVNWLKQYNIRQVQYMAGHKYISSTEKYKQEDLQDLQKALDLFHPLK